jgi:pimeloyl-ACP methyl ester carboxylesterase
MGTLQREDVVLNFETSGSGGTPLVFVHGWCSDHRFFRPQFEYFQGSHRVVAVDLRGHGESSKPREDHSIATYAADVAWLCEELNLDRPVIVGHSMGSFIALEVVSQFPSLVSAAVLVEPAPIVFSPQFQSGMPELVQALSGPHHVEAQRGFLEDSGMFFLPTDDPERKDWIVDAMTSVRQDVMLSSLMAMATWGGEALEKRWVLPALDIVGRNPLTDPSLLRTLCSDLEVVETKDVGHFNQLLAPDEVNRAMEEFLARVSVDAPKPSGDRAAEERGLEGSKR